MFNTFGKHTPPSNNKRDYPPELYTATRAEYVTMIRAMKKDKKKGCPFFVLTVLIRFSFLVGLTQLIG